MGSAVSTRVSPKLNTGKRAHDSSDVSKSKSNDEKGNDTKNPALANSRDPNLDEQLDADDLATVGDEAAFPSPLPTARIGDMLSSKINFMLSTKSKKEFPMLGLNAILLSEFVDICGGRSALFGMKTNEVHQQYIVSQSSKIHRSSYCEYLKSRGIKGVGAPTVFVSHRWNGLFLDLVDTLCQRFSSSPNTYLWIDMMSCRAVNVRDITFDWLNTQYRTALAKIGNTLIVASPTDNFAAFKNSSALFEIYCAVCDRYKVEIALNSIGESMFIDAFALDFAYASKILGSINAKGCAVDDAGDENNDDHKEEMEKALEGLGGEIKVNAVLTDAVRTWISEFITSTISKRSCDRSKAEKLRLSLGLFLRDQGVFEEAESLLAELLGVRRGRFGADPAETANIIAELAGVRFRRGKVEEAVALYQESLTMLEGVPMSSEKNEIEKTNAKYKILAECGLANVYTKIYKLEEAEKLLKGALVSAKKNIGDNNICSLRASRKLGAVYEIRGDLEEARQLFVTALRLSKNILGVNHAETLSLETRMGHVLLKLGRYEEALTLLRLTKDRGKEVLGANHKEVLKGKHVLAETLMARGDFEEASSMLRICLAARSRILGAEHEDTLDTSRSMATLYHMQGSIEMAESTYIDCMIKAEKYLGPKHRVTLQCRMKYAEMILDERNQPERAAVMLDKCVEGYKETVGLNNVSAKKAVELLEKARKLCGPTLSQSESPPVGAAPDSPAAEECRRTSNVHADAELKDCEGSVKVGDADKR